MGPTPRQSLSRRHETETVNGTWTVKRRWAPRHLGNETVGRRFRKRSKKAREQTGELTDLPGCEPDIGEGIFAVIGIALLILFFVFLGGSAVRRRPKPN